MACESAAILTGLSEPFVIRLPWKRKRSQTKIAMVLLHSVQVPDVPAMLEYARRWNDFDLVLDKTAEADRGVESAHGISFFRSQGAHFCLVPMSVPVPSTEFEELGPISWHWPEAVERLQEHKAHVILSISREEGSKLELASLLTKFAAGVAATSDSMAVYWGGGPVVYPRDHFLEFSEMLTDSKLPVPLWVGCYRGATEAGSDYLFTLGMEQFGHREIEMERVSRPTMEEVSLVYDLASYVLSSKKVIRDGDTVGDEDKPIRVRYRTSIYDASRKAMMLSRD